MKNQHQLLIFLLRLLLCSITLAPPQFHQLQTQNLQPDPDTDAQVSQALAPALQSLVQDELEIVVETPIPLNDKGCFDGQGDELEEVQLAPALPSQVQEELETRLETTQEEVEGIRLPGKRHKRESSLSLYPFCEISETYLNM